MPHINFKKWLLVLGLGLMPLAANAIDLIAPKGSNTWDLYVYGNGPAISAILVAIKLMIAPTSGGSSFQYLLLFLATAGFLAMAVKAGFDPAKNFVKMFMFILIVWAVSYSIRGAQSNVNVYDQSSQYSNVVVGVPALVAVPASIISSVGFFLTQEIETNFNLPNGMDGTGFNLSSGAQYDLFAKMISDANNFTISDPDLKRSVAAYMSDCVIPAIAQGKMAVNDLLNSPNLVDTLQYAKNQAIMTRYYMTEYTSASSGNGTANTPTGLAGPNCAAGGLDATQLSTTAPGLGSLVTCDQSYKCLASDLKVFASQLSTATASQWQSTGVTTPFETAMSSAIALAGAGGSANPQAGYSSPEGFILQKAMVSTSTQAFRQAATMTGNNEIMLATSLAQAEQSQKTSWYTASEIFKNMMGYVYTVLQAFIFAIVPVVVICLMIPGMGGTIFLNYIQILVWLTLWTPMLAIINFLIEIFGSSQLGSSLGADGLTMNNSALVSDQSSNLVLVAQFMGTLVPLMTWGLVKGAMAFTEFISHGIGSSFATQAGAQASTGNLSMGNIGMDNVTMDKYNTQRSIAVGQPPIDSATSGGSVLEKSESGGSLHSNVGTSANVTHGTSDTYSVSNKYGKTSGVSKADAQSTMNSNSQIGQEAQNLADMEQKSLAAMDAIRTGKDTHASFSASEAADQNKKIADMEAFTQDYNASAKAGIGGKIGFRDGVPAASASIDVGADYTAKRNRAYQAQAAVDQGIKAAHDRAEKAGTSASKDQSLSAGAGSSSSGGAQLSTAKAWSAQQSLSQVKTLTDANSADISASHTRDGKDSQNITESWNPNHSLEGAGADDVLKAGAAFASARAGAAQGIAAAGAAQDVQGHIADIGARTQGGIDNLHSGVVNAGATDANAPTGPALDAGSVTSNIDDDNRRLHTDFDHAEAAGTAAIAGQVSHMENANVISVPGVEDHDNSARRRFHDGQNPQAAPGHGSSGNF